VECLQRHLCARLANGLRANGTHRGA
jgi:hypothetical protein